MIGRGTIDRALLFHIMCLCSTSTPLPSPPPPAFYRVSGLHFAVSPLPVHRKLASSDPHQTSCEEVGPWKTSPEMGGGERSREGVPSMMGVVSSGGLTALKVPNLTYLTVRASTQHSSTFLLIRRCFCNCFNNFAGLVSKQDTKCLILHKSYDI